MALAEQVETLDKNQLLEKLGEVYDEMVMQRDYDCTSDTDRGLCRI